MNKDELDKRISWIYADIHACRHITESLKERIKEGFTQEGIYHEGFDLLLSEYQSIEKTLQSMKEIIDGTDV